MSETYDYINPQHYRHYSVETIDMMERIFGIEAVISYCELTAFKYRMRVGMKPDNSIEQDLAKEKWYKDRANKLRERRDENSGN